MTPVVTSRGFHLGKLDPVFPEGLDYFHSYFETPPPAPPAEAHYAYKVKVPWQMDGNGPDPAVTVAPRGWNGCGDCVICGLAHSLTTANFWENGVTDPVPSANTVVETYCQCAGCTPHQLFSEPTLRARAKII